MRLFFFVLLAINVAALMLQLTAWRVPNAVEDMSAEQHSLRLASEVDGRNAGAMQDERSADSEMCVLVGPFAESLAAEYFAEHLQALEVAAEVSEIEVPDGAGYWVYLPPAASKKLAFEKLREVQAKNIDSYLIPKGVLLNGISLGMFTRSELADLRQKEMIDLGYSAEIREISRTRKERWVTINRSDAQKIAEPTWVELMNREKGIEKRQIFCSGIASE